MAYSDYSDYIVYVDESGNSSLRNNNEKYPVFVLDFCIFEKNHYIDVVVPKIQTFKFDHFGHDNVILHEYEIRRQLGRFTFLRDERRRNCFMDGLSELIQEVDVSIVAAAIRKPDYKEKYINPWDPYVMAMLLCMERTYRFLKERNQHTKKTYIIMEKRGGVDDAELECAFHRICARGYLTQRRSMPNFEIEFADKKVNSAGLQLADLTARPIGGRVLRPRQSNRSWDIIKDKIYRGPQDQMEGYGLKVFP